MPNFYFAKIKSKIKLANDTFEYTFTTQEPFKHQPGQYIWLILNKLISPDPEGERRAFSICSSPQNPNIFSIVFRSSDSNFKKTLLQLAEGEEVKIWGPMGSSFIIDNKVSANVCFIGGGVGSAPFLSILRSLNFIPEKPNISFINLNTDESRMFLVPELQDLAQKQSFSFVNKTGRFDTKYISDNPNFKNTTYFICGVQGFVNDVYTKLRSLDISDEKMRFEEFYPKKDNQFIPEVTGRLNDPFDLAVQSSTNHIIITDQNGTIIYANKAASIITGYSNSEIIGQTPRVWGGLMQPDFYQNMWSLLKSGKAFENEVNNIRKNGEKYIAFVRIAPIFNSRKEIVGYVGTEEDITKAKEIDKMKSEFISLASHQLRTPLSAMRWLLEMILGGDAGALTDKQMEYFKNIEESNQRMINLVNRLLDISRIESGSLSIEPVETTLKDLVAGIVGEFKPESDKKNIDLLFEADPNMPQIKIDPKLIAEVYRNLLSNAIKYTATGGKVKVLIGLNKFNIVSQVIDNGMGIPDNEKSRIFDKFFRAENAVRIDTEGTGLGLYLAKDIVESSGGKIWFESTEGKGTTFYFSLPLTGSIAKKGEVALE